MLKSKRIAELQKQNDELYARLNECRNANSELINRPPIRVGGIVHSQHFGDNIICPCCGVRIVLGRTGGTR